MLAVIVLPRKKKTLPTTCILKWTIILYLNMAIWLETL